MERNEDKFAWTVTVGVKGQIVIPKEARVAFSIEPGDTLLILGDKEKGLAIPPKEIISEYFGQIFGNI